MIVLEAQEQVGGRVQGARSGGKGIDTGGALIANQHERIRRLAAELDVPLVKAGLAHGRVRWRSPEYDRVGYLPPGLPRLMSVGRTIARAAREVPTSQPWSTPVAATLDQRSVDDLFAEQPVVGTPAEWVRAQIEGLATVPLGELSLLQLAWWVSRAGGVFPALRGTLALVGADGTYRLVEALHRELDSVVRTGSPVSAVTAHGDDHVTVSSSTGEVEARAVVMAVPAPALRDIKFTPPLKARHGEAVRQTRFGAAAKVVALATMTPSRWRAVVGGEHLKVAWRIGDRLAGMAPHLTDVPPPDHVLVEELAEAFDLTPHQLVDPQIVDWAAQPWIGGTYVAYAPGQLTRHAPALGPGVAPLWFAAAERSSWPNSMEGAVESGEATAQRVARRLAR